MGHGQQGSHRDWRGTWCSCPTFLLRYCPALGRRFLVACLPMILTLCGYQALALQKQVYMRCCGGHLMAVRRACGPTVPRANMCSAAACQQPFNKTQHWGTLPWQSTLKYLEAGLSSYACMQLPKHNHPFLAWSRCGTLLLWVDSRTVCCCNT